MRVAAVFLLLLRVIPSVSQEAASTAECILPGTSSPTTKCNGIQGTEKNADICCAAECTCTCGGQSVENANKACFLGQIRGDPPGYCTGFEDATAACIVAPPEPTGQPCGEVAVGVLDADGRLCCPEGCGTCGGEACSVIPMSWVMPASPLTNPLALDASVPVDATSKDYCCTNIMDTLTAVCGVNGAVAPCLMPQVIETKVDTCGVAGIVGTKDQSGSMCCPLGCDICGSPGCGDQHISYVVPGDLPWSTSAPEGAKTSDYCCTSAFLEDFKAGDRFCGVGEGGEVVEPPCVILPPTLPPRGDILDTCGVEGIEGIASGNKCCPIGCGQCGGSGCGSIDMDYITPTLGFTAPSGTKSSAYCCSGITTFNEATPTCGEEGGVPPCYIPAGVEPTLAPGAPTPVVTGTLPPSAAGALIDTCGLPGIPGVMDSTGARCCPQGCGMCGGPGCGARDMSIVGPTVVGGVPLDAKSSDYCCNHAVDTRNVFCGTGEGQGHPPCFIPAETATPTCMATDTGIGGVVSASGTLCCPLGCGQCGGSGCGSVPTTQIFTDGRVFPVGATASDFCCTKAFTSATSFCDDVGAEPPCLVRGGTPVPAGAPLATASPVAGGNGGVTATPSPADGSTPRGGTFTLAPSGEMMACKVVSVNLETVEDFNGAYVMADENTFMKEDGTAMLVKSLPAETKAPSTTPPPVGATTAPTPEPTPGSTVAATAGTTVAATAGTTVATTAAQTAGNTVAATEGASMTRKLTECFGGWVLFLVEDGVTVESPKVHVQDCAENPEDIAVGAAWVVNRIGEQSEITSGYVECIDTMAPTPAPSSIGSAGGSGDGHGDGDGGNGGAVPDATTPAPVITEEPVSPTEPAPPTSDRAAPTTVTGDDGSGDGSGLSTGQAVGIGVGAGAVALVAGVGIAKWAKGG